MVYLEKDPRFYNKIMEVSKNVGISPEDLLVVMTLESGINPTIHNKNYGGLTQMSNSTLKGLGYSGDVKDFSNEPAFKQLDFIEKQILKLKSWIGGDFETVEQYYLGNLLPVSLKLQGVKNKDPKTIIISENPDVPHLPGVSIEKEKIFYNSNKGLDLDKDGNITYNDITNFLNKKRKESHYMHAMQQMKDVAKYEPAIKENKEIKNNKIFDMIDNLLQKAAGIKKKDNITICITSSDNDVSSEFARILSMALREDFNLNSTVHKNENVFEITCKLENLNIKKIIIGELVESLSKNYFNKIGVKLNTNIINKKSNFKILDSKDILKSHRKILTKYNFNKVNYE